MTERAWAAFSDAVMRREQLGIWFTADCSLAGAAHQFATDPQPDGRMAWFCLRCGCTVLQTKKQSLAGART